MTQGCWESCRGRAVVHVKVQPDGDDRYHIEQLTLEKVDGRWLVSSIGRDR